MSLPVHCPSCGYANNEPTYVYVKNECENCGYKPLRPTKGLPKEMGIVGLIIGVIFLIGPFFSFGLIAWTAVLETAWFFFKTRKSTDELEAARRKVRVISIATMFLVGFVAFITAILKQDGNGEMSDAALLLGFLAWDSSYNTGKVFACFGLLIWAGIVAFAKTRFSSPEVIERNIQARVEAEKEQQRLAEEAEKEQQRLAEEALEQQRQTKAKYDQPFAWETEMPAIPKIIPLSNEKDASSQALVDTYLCSNREFWKAFQQSLKLPSSNYQDDDFSGLRALAYRYANSDINGQLSPLNLFCVLKGEYLLGQAGFTILTNMRLLFNYDGWWTVPFTGLKNYILEDGPLEISWERDGQPHAVSLTGTCFIAEPVLEALAAFDANAFDLHQQKLLWLTREELVEQSGNSVQWDLIEPLDPDEGL